VSTPARPHVHASNSHSRRPASVAQVVEINLPSARSFEIVAVYLLGLSLAIASARPCAKVFTVSQSASGVSGTTTWRPLPPVVFTKLSSRIRPEPLAHLGRTVN